MKKRIVAVMLSLMLMGCSRGNQRKEYEKPLEGKELDVEVISVKQTERISTYLGLGLTATPPDENMEFVDVILDVKNKTKQAINIKDAINIKPLEAKQDYETIIYFEADNKLDIVQQDSITEQTQSRVHLVIPINKDSEINKLSLSLDKQEVELAINMKTYEAINLNNNPYTGSTLDVTIKSSYYSKQLIPKDTKAEHTYLEVNNPDKEIFLILDLKLTNKTEKEIAIQDYLGFKPLDFNNPYDYTYYGNNKAQNNVIEVKTLKPQESFHLQAVTIVDKDKEQSFTQIKGLIEGKPFNYSLESKGT